MFDFVKAGGFLMLPILLCSVIALAITIERAFALRKKRIIPDNLVAQVWQWAKAGTIDPKRIHNLRTSSPLGRVLAAGLVNMKHDREIMKESIEEVGRHVVHDLERYLNTLGTIAAITPLLGLLGTVFGMIEVFSAITSKGVGDATVLADGISKALITTAAGLSIAIPSLISYRYFKGKIDDLVVAMEQEALKLIEVIHGERESEPSNPTTRTSNADVPDQKRSTVQSSKKSKKNDMAPSKKSATTKRNIKGMQNESSSRDTDDVELNLTPLIDVVFLLLIFFMVSTTFVKESEIKLNLPEASTATVPDEKETITISIDASNRYFVNSKALINSQTETIEKAIKEFAGDDPNPTISIDADKQADYQSVVTVLDAARRLKFLRITFVTERPKETE